MNDSMKNMLALLVVLGTGIIDAQHGFARQPGKVPSIEGQALDDRLLGMQRWFAALTVLQEQGSQSDIWSGGWYRDEEQLGLGAYRYQLAFLGYAAGSLAYWTPAYRELSGLILDDVIQRMIRKDVWDYIPHYWSDHAAFPDPVALDNIMYSGHLLQLIALYEAVTGDMKYATDGWDFVWDAQTRFHYTTESLALALYNRMLDSVTGGLACEPDMVFITCNNHQLSAFKLIDAVHGTDFSRAGQRWMEWLETHAQLKEEQGAYLRFVYHEGEGNWATEDYGIAANDAWSLAWMLPWSDHKSFVEEGFAFLINNKAWREQAAGSYIEAEDMSVAFGAESQLVSSFYALLEAQLHPGMEVKRDGVFQYYLDRFGTWTDAHGLGNQDAFFVDTGWDAIWVTANLALAMAVAPVDLKTMYSTDLSGKVADWPYLKHVDYRNVAVRRADYEEDGNRLLVTLEHLRPGTPSLLVFDNISGLEKISSNGTEVRDFQGENGILTFFSQGSGREEIVIELKMQQDAFARLIPHITSADGGFETTLFVDNTLPTAAEVRLLPYDRDGNQLPEMTLTVEAGHRAEIRAEALGGAGHCAVVSHEAVKVVAGYRKRDGLSATAHVPETNLEGTEFHVIPGEGEVVWDGFVVINKGETPARLTLEVNDGKNQVLLTSVLSESLPPRAKLLGLIPTVPGAALVKIRTNDVPAGVLFLRGTHAGTEPSLLFQTLPIPGRGGD